MRKVNLSLTILVMMLVIPLNIYAASSITQYGITWTFDHDYETGQFVNGDYWVVGPVVNIIGIDPPSVVPSTYIVSSSSPWDIWGSNGQIRATIYVSNTTGITAGIFSEVRVDGTNNPKVDRNTYVVASVNPNVSFDILLDPASEDPAKIAEIGPVSGGNFGGHELNGSMINPIVGASQWPYQGFDSRALKFKGALNVAYNISSGHPLQVPAGSSLVSTISLVPSSRYNHYLETGAVLTVLPTAPPADSFRPPYIGTDKTIKYNLSTVASKISSLPKMTIPNGAIAWPLTGLVNGKQYDRYDHATWPVERMFERPWLMTMSTDLLNYLMPMDNLPSYGREVSLVVGIGAMSLCMDYTDEEKLSLLKKYVQVGIDLYEYVVYGANQYWAASGGIRSGRKLPILIAGKMLDDPDMLGIGSLTPEQFAFQEDEQTFYVEAKNIGVHCSATGLIDHIYGQSVEGGAVTDPNVYTSAHIGMPEWGINHIQGTDTGWPHYISVSGVRENLASDRVDWAASYRSLNAYSWPGIALAAQAMGLKTVWNHNAFFDYMDRYMAATAPDGAHPDAGLRALDGFSGQMWDTYRANYGPVWTSTGSMNNLTISGGAELRIYNNVMKGAGAQATVKLITAQSGSAAVRIYDSKGKEIICLWDGYKDAGTCDLIWTGLDSSGSKVGSGVYMVNMKAGGYNKTKKIVVIK